MISLSLTLVINCYRNTGLLKRSELPEEKCFNQLVFCFKACNLPVSPSTFGSTGRGLELTIAYSLLDGIFLVGF